MSSYQRRNTIMRSSYKLTKNYGPTHNDIQSRAFKLWQEDGEPDAEIRSPDYFWEQAQKELIPEVQRAIEQELSDWIKVNPSNEPMWPYSYCYYDKFWSKDKLDTRQFAEGRLDDNGKYELRILDREDAPHQKIVIGFDLNSEESLIKLLQTIEEAGVKAKEHDKDIIGKIIY